MYSHRPMSSFGVWPCFPPPCPCLDLTPRLHEDGDLKTFRRRREAELKNGRVAMFATMGCRWDERCWNVLKPEKPETVSEFLMWWDKCGISCQQTCRSCNYLHHLYLYMRLYSWEIVELNIRDFPVSTVSCVWGHRREFQMWKELNRRILI